MAIALETLTKKEACGLMKLLLYEVASAKENINADKALSYLKFFKEKYADINKEVSEGIGNISMFFDKNPSIITSSPDKRQQMLFRDIFSDIEHCLDEDVSSLKYHPDKEEIRAFYRDLKKAIENKDKAPAEYYLSLVRTTQPQAGIDRLARNLDAVVEKRFFELCFAGNRCLVSNDFNGAVSSYTGALEIFCDGKESYELFFNRGLAYEGLKNINLAHSDFSKAIELMQKKIILEDSELAEIAEIYLKRGVTNQLLGDADSAFFDFTMSLSFSKNPGAYLKRISIMESENNLEGQLEDYKELSKLVPDNSSILLSIAILNCRLGNLSEAVDVYSRVVELDPLNSSAYYYSGLANEELCRMDEAHTDYQRSILISRSAEACMKCGNMWLNKGDFKRAFEDYMSASDLGSSTNELLLNLGTALLGLKHFERAEEFFELILDAGDIYATNARLNLAVVKLYRNDIEGAELCCDQVLSLDPANDKALFNKGIINYTAGNMNEAARCFFQASRINPANIAAVQNYNALVSLNRQIFPRYAVSIYA